MIYPGSQKETAFDPEVDLFPDSIRGRNFASQLIDTWN